MSTSKNHNKKRNSGLIYEFLVRAISAAIIENDNKRSAIALKLLKKYFKPETELYREFRLINALVKTNVSSEHTAASILVEAKRAARESNCAALDKEKSLLIRDINCVLNDENFFDRHINEYKDYATVQQLLNCWRSDYSQVDIAQLAKYEEHLMNRLTAKKFDEVAAPAAQDDGPGMNRLVMKLMMKRLNEKYSSTLLPEQKSLIKSYAFSSAREDASVLKQRLSDIREEIIKAIDTYITTSSDKYVCEKMQGIRKQLLDENIDVINDDTVTRFLLYVKLRSELESGDE
jgi:hypothetical protein